MWILSTSPNRIAGIISRLFPLRTLARGGSEMHKKEGGRVEAETGLKQRELSE